MLVELALLVLGFIIALVVVLFIVRSFYGH